MEARAALLAAGSEAPWGALCRGGDGQGSHFLGRDSGAPAPPTLPAPRASDPTSSQRRGGGTGPTAGPRSHRRTMLPPTREPSPATEERAGPGPLGGRPGSHRPPAPPARLCLPSAHPSHRPGRSSPRGRCSGPRRRRRCPRAGRGRPAGSPRHAGPRGRLGDREGSEVQHPPARPAGAQSPPGEGQREDQRRTWFGDLTQDDQPQATWAHQPSRPGHYAPPPRAPALPSASPTSIPCPRRPCRAQRGGRTPQPGSGHGLPCRQLGPVQPGPQ